MAHTPLKMTMAQAHGEVKYGWVSSGNHAAQVPSSKVTCKTPRRPREKRQGVHSSRISGNAGNLTQG